MFWNAIYNEPNRKKEKMLTEHSEFDIDACYIAKQCYNSKWIIVFHHHHHRHHFVLARNSDNDSAFGDSFKHVIHKYICSFVVCVSIETSCGFHVHVKRSVSVAPKTLRYHAISLPESLSNIFIRQMRFSISIFLSGIMLFAFQRLLLVP